MHQPPEIHYKRGVRIAREVRRRNFYRKLDDEYALRMLEIRMETSQKTNRPIERLTQNFSSNVQPSRDTTPGQSMLDYLKERINKLFGI